jgi:cysteine desulfurase
VKGIYLDHNATTPVLRSVVTAMLPFLSESPGNPSKAHLSGAEARAVIEVAREQVGDLAGASPSHVLFTSSATEAINTAFHSALASPTRRGFRIITTAVEHPAVLQSALTAGTNGAQIIQLPVDRCGVVSLDQLADAIADDTCLVSVMWADNETGVIFPIPEIAQLCDDRDVSLYVDAV